MNMIIDGNFIGSSDGKVFNNVNPATGEVICTVPLGTAEDFEKAAEAAKKSQPAWAARTIYERAEIITKYIELVKENAEEIAQTMCAEGGKHITVCRGEVDCFCVVFEVYREAARNLCGHSIPLNAEPRTVGDVIFTIREPLGVFADILPFNFPVELYAHKVAPALITGNSVIIKPASDTPKSAMILTQLLLKAGVPSGVAQLITGSGKVVGEWLKDTKNVDAISFTGSTSVGMDLMRGGANNLQRVFLELGGNDPFVLFDDGDIALAVTEAVEGRCIYNSGQTCCANKRFLVHNAIKDEFTTKLVEALIKVTVGDPSKEETGIGPLISEAAAEKFISDIEYTVSQGARCVLGGKRNGTFVEPTVLVDVTPDMDISKDLEVFGPAFPIIGFDTLEEAVEISNSTSYGLASGVITKNMYTAMQYASQVKAGTCVINGSGNYRSIHQPFGGYKHSGIGREGTTHTLLEVTQEKSIVLKKVL